ncbi:fibronectin type III domain-containing protein [Rathayibacter sp. AY1B7]|uniref:fibronectin type III domain-containing protein n=1 Tax=Rathayibacter sp. AY1B7 TaxID=2080532 RepID=UPI0011B01193|nr:fibronectin type III domain-containing protein [Rathayibacter sp. AY1B7]
MLPKLSSRARIAMLLLIALVLTALPAAPALAATAFTAAPTPTITGTTTVGETLTANPGTWNPVPTFTYQWKRGTTVISGATGATYTLVTADAGATLTVAVTGTKDGFTTTSKTSAPTATITTTPVAFTTAPVPTITGATTVGSTLTANPGTWNPVPTFTYQWYRSGTPIAGATSSGYRIVLADAGALLTVTVTGSKAGYSTATLASNPVEVALPVPEGSDRALIVESLPLGLGAWISWLPDARDDLTGYRLVATAEGEGVPVACASASPLSKKVPASDSSTMFAGLCEGVIYRFTVQAELESGFGLISPPSTPVVPWPTQAPEAPLISGLIGRNGTITVGWIAPAYDGGTAVDGYVISALDDGVVVSSATAGVDDRSVILAGLTNDREYTVRAVAKNVVGPSEPSEGTAKASNIYTPDVPIAAQAVPDGSGAVELAWSPPVDDGGSPIASYTVGWQQAARAEDGTWVIGSDAAADKVSLNASQTTFTVEGLDGSQYYFFSISATNSAGTGQPWTSENAVTPTITLEAETIVLTDESAVALLTVEEDTFTWPLPAPSDVADLRAGDIVVIPPGPLLESGTMREVVSIDTFGNGLVVTTTSADFADAFDSFTLDANVELVDQVDTESNLRADSSFRPDRPGVMASSGTEVGATLSQTFPIEFRESGANTCSGSERSGGGKICGGWAFKASLSLTPSVSTGLSVKDGELTTRASASIKTTASVSGSVSASRQWNLGTIQLPHPIVFMIGTVPVTIRPQIPITLKVDGAATVSLSASMTLGSGMSYSSKDGQVVGIDLTDGPHFDAFGAPDSALTAQFKGTVTLGVEAKVLIYDFFEASMAARLALFMTVQSKVDPWFNLEPKLSLTASLALSILNYDLGRTTVDVATAHLPSVTLNGTPKPAYALSASNYQIPPGASVTAVASRSDGITKPVTWSLNGGTGGDRISNTGVFTASSTAPGDRVVKLSAKDSDGIAGSVQIYVGMYIAPPSDARVSASAVGLVTVQWDASPSPGVVGYRISANPISPYLRSAGQSATFSLMQPGVLYTVNIISVTSGGKTSAPLQLIFSLDGNGRIHEEPGGNWDTEMKVIAQGLTYPVGIAVDPAGNTYLRSNEEIVQKVTPNGTVTTFAGNGQMGEPRPGRATQSPLNGLSYFDSDAAGNVYFGTTNHIVKVTAAGQLSIIAGNGTSTCPGDYMPCDPPTSGNALSTGLGGTPSGIAVDSAGNVFASTGAYVLKITPAGQLSRVAGAKGIFDWTPLSSSATDAVFGDSSVRGIDVDASGNLYAALANGSVIVKITPNGQLQVVAGDLNLAGTGDGALPKRATEVGINGVSDVKVDSQGNIFIVDYGNNRVTRVDASGMLTVAAGASTDMYGNCKGPTVNGPALSHICGPMGIAVDRGDNLFIALFKGGAVLKVRR